MTPKPLIDAVTMNIMNELKADRRVPCARIDSPAPHPDFRTAHPTKHTRKCMEEHMVFVDPIVAKDIGRMEESE